MKIFCIGMPKTGTTSCEKALINLGYKVSKGKTEWLDHLWMGERLPEGGWDCLSNVAEWHFKLLHKLYPKAKFILTTRPLDDWLKSVEIAISREQTILRGNKNIKHKLYYIDMYRRFTFEKEHFKDLFEDHYNKVIKYFEDKPDSLLEIDIIDNNNMKKLCTFLGKEHDGSQWPHQHKTLKDGEGVDGGYSRSWYH